MSLTSTMFTGVSGLLNQAEAMNVIGNNISNVNTLGFKGSRMLFSDVLSTSVGSQSVGQLGHGVQIQKVDTVFAQSSLETTTSPTDVAVQGANFFVVAKPGTTTAGSITSPADAFYTRAGAFRVDSNRALITPDNYNVLDSNSDPIVFPLNDSTGLLTFQKVSSISAKGEIALLYSDATGNSSTEYYNGNGVPSVTTIPAAVAPASSGVRTLGTAKIPNPPGMEKIGGSLFRQTGTITGGSGTPVIGGQNGTTESILANNLELSNVDMANEFVKMILTQRAYSANSKTITTSDEMTQEILNLKR